MAITLNKLLPGKLDHDFLGLLIEKYTTSSTRVIEGARIGEDATVIDMGDKVLVTKTDPVTFATDQIGTYAVHVNANDIVCMGAEPKWFLATILLPERATRRMAERIFAQISKACKKEKIAYCGGHTEVTVGLERPIVVGQMLGEAAKENLLLKRNIKIGDHLILIQAVPLEGVSILAREREADLAAQFTQDFVKRCQKLITKPGISVRSYARRALATATVHAMHDPTEGGVATAIHEMATAAGTGVIVDKSKIPVLTEGKLACEYFDIDPLGCISSGSLLLAVPYKSIEPILKAFAKANIPASDIGKFIALDEGNVFVENNKKRRLPVFTQDEILKIF